MQGDPHRPSGLGLALTANADADDARVSDATLIGRTAAGDRAAFEPLVPDDPAAFVSLRERGKAAGWGIEDQSFVDRLVDAETLAGALASLSTEDREILILCELEALPPADAAGVAGLAEGTARNRLHRARL